METKKRKRTSTKKDTKANPKKVKQESDDDEFEEKEIPDIEDSHAPKTFLCTHNDSYHQFRDNEIQTIRSLLLQWYDESKRDLPWRKAEVKNGEDDQMDEERGYAVWVSEIMLQQTRVQTVIDYYKKWMKKWPTIQDLAKATLEEVNEVWSGLGYYRRAKFLHEGAKMVVEKLKGKLPRTAKQLEEIPGIGKYTAGAIASIAFGKVFPLVGIDGNVVRVLSRLRAIGGDPKSKKAIQLHWRLADQLVDTNRPGNFNQSLMELGATLCTAQNPSCSSCPVREYCHAYKELEDHQGKQKESFQKKEKVKKEEDNESDAKQLQRCTVCEDWDEVNTPTTTVMKYPRKVKKTAQREEWVAAYIMEFSESTSDPQYLLVQRPATGLLANLWEFPQVMLSEDEKQEAEGGFSTQIQLKLEKLLKKELGLSEFLVKKRTHLGSIVHLFSHIKQNIFVEHLVLSKYEQDPSESSRSTRWVSEEEMNGAAISKIVKKCYSLKKSAKNSKSSPSKPVKSSTTNAKNQPLLTSFLVKKTS